MPALTKINTPPHFYTVGFCLQSTSETLWKLVENPSRGRKNPVWLSKVMHHVILSNRRHCARRNRLAVVLGTWCSGRLHSIWWRKTRASNGCWPTSFVMELDIAVFADIEKELEQIRQYSRWEVWRQRILTLTRSILVTVCRQIQDRILRWVR
jgi:hypothetical protein